MLIKPVSNCNKPFPSETRLKPFTTLVSPVKTQQNRYPENIYIEKPQQETESLRFLQLPKLGRSCRRNEARCPFTIKPILYSVYSRNIVTFEKTLEAKRCFSNHSETLGSGVWGWGEYSCEAPCRMYPLKRAFDESCARLTIHRQGKCPV